MTQPSDRARKAAADYYDTVGSRLTSGWKHAQAIRIGARDADPLVQLFATFERETPGFAAGVEAAELMKLANRLCNTIPRDDWRLIVRVAAAIRNLTPAPPASETANVWDRLADHPFVRGFNEGLKHAPPASEGVDLATAIDRFLTAHDPNYASEDIGYQSRAHERIVQAIAQTASEGLDADEKQSRLLHKALIASMESFVPPLDAKHPTGER